MWIDSFQKYLHNDTIQYIQSFHKDNVQLDIKQISDQLKDNIFELEDDLIKQFQETQEETNILIKEIEETNQIVESVQLNLGRFTQSFNQTQEQINNIFEQSETLNNQMNIYQEMDQNFQQFIDNILIDPQMIQNLLINEINEDYCKELQLFQNKLIFIYSQPQQIPSIKEIWEEIDILKNKTIQRIRDFIFNLIASIQKGNLINDSQKELMLNFSQLFVFLKLFNKQIFFELSLKYSNITNKNYNNHFKQLIKSQQQKLIPYQWKCFDFYIDGNISEAIQNLVNQSLQQTDQYKELQNFKQISLQEFIILLLEEFYQFYNKETQFTQKLFELSEEENYLFIQNIFQELVNVIKQKIQSLLLDCFDIIILFLIFNYIQKKIQKETKENNNEGMNNFLFSLLKFLFDQIYVEINKIFTSIEPKNIKNINQTIQQVGQEKFIDHIANIYISLQYFNINNIFQEKFDFTTLLIQYQIKVFIFFEIYANQKTEKKTQQADMLNSLLLFKNKIQNCDIFSKERINEIEENIQESQNKFIQTILQKHLQFFSQINEEIKTSNIQNINKYISQIYNEISYKLQTIKQEINIIIKWEQTSKKILQKIHQQILEDYEQILKQIKQENIKVINQLSLEELNSIIIRSLELK